MSVASHRAAQARWARSAKGRETQRRYRERWHGTCEVCGAKTSEPRFNRCGEHNRTRISPWSRERIIEAMQLWRLVYGKNPVYDDWDRKGGERFLEWHTAGLIPWNSTVSRRFGSWGAAIAALEASTSTLVLVMRDEKPHGLGRYTNDKCRCETCRAANRAYHLKRSHETGRRRPMEVYLAERRANLAPHGTETRYTNQRCRCTECREASRVARARRRARAVNNG